VGFLLTTLINNMSRLLCGSRRVGPRTLIKFKEKQMGRPIKKKYFGNLNLPKYGSVGQGTGVGGEGFSAVVLVNSTLTTFYSTTTAVTWTASAPQITGGVAATGTATVSGAGRVTALNLSTPGSGYTSTSSVTITLSPATTGTAVSYAVQLTSNRQDAFVLTSYIPTGSASRTGGDILKQEASTRYLVKNSDGTGQCRLASTSTLVAGQMSIIATDWNGSTYYVTKMTAHRVRLVHQTESTAFLINNGSVAKWTFDGATGTTVTLANTN